jgi:hypothetical protein
MAPLNETPNGLQFSTGLIRFLLALAAVGGLIAGIGMKYEREHSAIDRRIYADSIRHNGTEGAVLRIERSTDETNRRLTRFICSQQPNQLFCDEVRRP